MINNVVLFIGTVFAFYLLLRMFCLWTILFLLRIRVIVAPLGISVGAFFHSTMMTFSAASTEKSTDLFWFFNCCEITVTSIRLFLTFLWSGGADSNSLKTVCLTPMSSQETGVPKQVLVCLAFGPWETAVLLGLLHLPIFLLTFHINVLLTVLSDKLSC